MPPGTPSHHCHASAPPGGLAHWQQLVYRRQLLLPLSLLAVCVFVWQYLGSRCRGFLSTRAFVVAPFRNQLRDRWGKQIPICSE